MKLRIARKVFKKVDSWTTGRRHLYLFRRSSRRGLRFGARLLFAKRRLMRCKTPPCRLLSHRECQRNGIPWDMAPRAIVLDGKRLLHWEGRLRPL